MSDVPVPVAPTERVAVLDVLRGVAIFGILIANMVVVSGYWFLEEAERAALSTAALDGWVYFFAEILIEAKFYSIFSLLFGIGFAIQLGRADARGVAFPAFFRRRLLGLFLIGAFHAVFLWAGDILLLYALLGLLLVPFRQFSDRELLRAAVVCLVLPIVVYALMLAAAGGGAPPATTEAAAAVREPPEFFRKMLLAFQEGTWFEAWRANLIYILGRWADLFFTVRFPKVFGMFLLGFLVGRSGVAQGILPAPALLRRVVAVALLVGLPASVLSAWLAEQDVWFPTSPLGLLQTTAAAIGVPLLALGYSAGVALLVQGGVGARLLAPLAAPGRMALTNYMLHSLIMTFIFYGWGLGWYGRVGPAATTLLALAICAAQVPLSRWWLARYRYGPVEWLWRQFTYRQRLPLRHGSVAASR